MQDTFLTQLKNFADLIVKPIVSYPNEIHIACERKQDHVRVFISDQPRCDQGKILGRGQQTLWAIRCLIQSFAAKHIERAEVQLMEPVKDLPAPEIPSLDSEWSYDKSKEIGKFTTDILEGTIRSYTGEVLASDKDGVTTITAKCRDITPILATALGRIVKLAGRMKGRKIEFRAQS